ncbi:twin-arginine translocation signal domain-containing protein [Marinobacter salsuginis]|uniref:twin-arginine translocation signal domain-containing protein n=1 Tax=Marinobacter salsuginis TaxID=418719 RepID=UPI001AE0B73D|nr:twin-arginine translocation signal domain-containing protein [Marinobacter salsuginis]QTN42181.1 twin-arginine translocation signal domain-containing protein [Marinobacter salsuginis]
MSQMSDQTKEAIDQINRISRRSFLKAASGIAVAASVGTGLLGAASAFASTPEGINVMSASEYQVMRRLMQVQLVTEGTGLVPASEIPVMQTLDAALLATMAPHILQGLKGGIAYFNDGPKGEYGKPFVELSDKQAAVFCATWANSDEVPHRALAMGLKKLVGLSYWANPPTWKPLGYGGPVSEKWNLQSLGNAPLPKS